MKMMETKGGMVYPLRSEDKGEYQPSEKIRFYPLVLVYLFISYPLSPSSWYLASPVLLFWRPDVFLFNYDNLACDV